MILIAHRGASAQAPENTMVAFNRAKIVADFVEFDVWPTRDGELVVLHDSTVDRTTNGKGSVIDFTLSQLRELDAGKWFGAAFAGEKIPTADETIGAIQTVAAPFVERKGGTVAQFVALLDRQPLRPEGIVMSFDYAFVIALKRAKPDVQVGWVGSGALTRSQIIQATADGITHFIWSHSGLDRATVKLIHQAGGLVFAWTVNDMGTVGALDDMGVDGIISDRVEEFGSLPAFSSPCVGDGVQPPNKIVIRTGSSAVLAATASGQARRSVEWRRAGDAKVLGNGSRFMFKADGSQSSCDYVASWKQNGEARAHKYSITSGAADNQLINISARMTIGAGEATGIVGFVVKSTQAPRFLLRAVGPSLAAFGILDPIRDPALTVYRRGVVIDSDSTGSRTKAAGADSARNGAFPLVPTASDVAILKHLEGGAYTVHMSSTSNQTGMGLIEVYQDNASGNWALGAPVNISLRGRVVQGSPLIGGFVVPAGSSQTVLVRGIGPSLSRFGIESPLRDPVIRIYNSQQTIVAENDDWWSEGDSKEIESFAGEVGAFHIGTGREASILVTLAPGAYTAILADAAGTREGVGLLEIYAISSESVAKHSLLSAVRD